MSWHLTVGETALIAPLAGAPVGAIIAWLASRWTTEATTRTQRDVATITLEAQRALARDQWLRDKRAEIYPGLINSIQQIQWKLVPSRWSQVEMPEAFRTYSMELRGQTTSLLLAYGSPRLRESFSEYLILCADYSRDIVRSQNSQAGSVPLKELKETAEATIMPASATLRDDLIAELQG